MKITVALSFLFFNSLFGQYSNYYNVDVKGDYKISINSKQEISKTIKTIDYAELRKVEVEKQKLEFEKNIYSDNKSIQDARSIAENPLNAYSLGNDVIKYSGKKDIAKSYGFKKFQFIYREPSRILYEPYGAKEGGFRYINESNGISTVLVIGIPSHPTTKEYVLELNKKERVEKQEYFRNSIKNLEDYALKNLIYTKGINFAGTSQETYLHKYEIEKAKVARMDGYLITYFIENKYQKSIIEKYIASDSNLGFLVISSVTYEGDTKKVEFEQLESRREYLSPLNRKILTTPKIFDFKLNE